MQEENPMPTGRPAFAAWLADNASLWWPLPTGAQTFADLVVAPIENWLGGILQKPFLWWLNFRSRVAAWAESQGAGFASLSLEQVISGVLDCWESYCIEENVSPYWGEA